MKQFVVCACNRHRETGRKVCGARHFDSIMREQMHDTGGFPYWNSCEQGFIDQFGQFLTREQAWKIADAAGQIRRPTGWEKDDEIKARPANIGDEGKLFSENLY